MARRSKITVMNQALALSGQAGKEITEGSTGPEFTLLDRWYPEVVGAAFEDGDFNFGRVRLPLTTRSEGDFGFDDAWLLPSSVLHIIRAFVNERDRDDWESDGSYLYINATANVEIEFVQEGQEAKWSSKFTKAIARELASLLKEGINEEYEEARDVMMMSEREMMKAGVHASKQRGRRRPFRRGFLINQRSYGYQRFRYRGGT